MLLVTGLRITHASSRKLPRLRVGGSFLEEALALIIWLLDFLDRYSFLCSFGGVDGTAE